MSGLDSLVICTFTMPEKIWTDPQSMLWFLPLAASIAVVYKATKLPKITARTFLKDGGMLFGSIVVFIVVAAMVLYALEWVITEGLPAILGLARF